MSGEPFDMNDDTGVGASGLRGVGASEEPLAVAAGDLLDGRYRVGEPLGRGGMGYVFAATDERLRRPVAVKVIRPELARHPQVVARFEREALASSRLNSPHVVVVHDFGATEQGLLYLVMERLEGAPLGRLLKKSGAMEPTRALEVAQQIARALEAAHAAGITHRDLKPANIFLCSDGNAKVLDFGIAKIAEPDGGAFGSAGLTSTGMMLGTPLFMSPEAASPHGTVGPPADIYALGTLLFSMLAGQPPFSHEEPVVVMSMHMREAAPRMHHLLPEIAVGEDAERLVKHMLGKDPAARPSATEALATLSALVADPLAGELAAPETTHAGGAETPPASAPPPPEESGPEAAEGWTVSIRALAISAATIGALVSLLVGVAVVRVATSGDEGAADVSAVPLAPLAAAEGDVPEATPARAETGGEAEAAGEAETPSEAPAVADTEAESPPEEGEQPEPTTVDLEPVEMSPATGRLAVEVSPGGAVFVDGRPLGRAPVETQLPVGEHRLVVRRRGQVEERRVRVEEGQTTRESVRLRRAPNSSSNAGGGGSSAGGDLSGIPERW